MSDQPYDDPPGVIVSPPDNGFTVRVDRHQVVNAHGELDAATDLQFAAVLSSLVAEGGVICVDFSALAFCGAAGINVLFGAVQALGTRGRIVIYDRAPQVTGSSPSADSTASSTSYTPASGPHRPLGGHRPRTSLANATSPPGHIESPGVDPRTMSAA